MVNKSLILKKIKEYIGFKKESYFANFLVIKQNTLSTWHSRNTFDVDLISRKCDFLNYDWLLTGNGPMLKEETKSDVEVYEMPDAIIKAPLIGQYANGGYLRGYADPEYLEEQPAFYSTRKHNGGNYIAFEVRVESMNDESIRAISEGDILLGMELKKDYWQPGVKLHIPKVFIIVHRTEGITIKEIIEHDPDSGRTQIELYYFSHEVIYGNKKSGVK